jgi:hypothetical protein
MLNSNFNGQEENLKWEITFFINNESELA